MKNKPLRHFRYCKTCGKSFHVQENNQKLCEKCLKPQRKPKVVKVKYNIVCKTCGRVYISEGEGSKYCSLYCRKNYALNKIDYNIAKEKIFKRDNYTCIYCGRSPIEDNIKLHLEHIYPVSKGGGEDLFNLATSCMECNLEKKDELLPEKVILKIWERNYNLNSQYGVSDYKQLTESFRENLVVRKRTKR